MRAVADETGRPVPDAPAVAAARRSRGRRSRASRTSRTTRSFACSPTSSRVEPSATQIGSSGEESIAFHRFARARFALAGAEHELELYWLTGYGGGLFLPFRDETSGSETYGGGRYLFDTVKGADLGSRRRAARARLQLRLQPVVQLRPALGLPALAAGEPAAGRDSRRRADAGLGKPEAGLEPAAPSLQDRCSAS